MAYQSLHYETDVGVATRPEYAGRAEFRRLERIVVLVGSVALGGGAGFAAAIALGRPGLTEIVLSGGLLLTLALYLCTQTLRESLVRNAYGCATATIVHAAALLAWPMAGLFAPLSPLLFWAAPAAAISALAMFASCWGGPPRAVYRLGLQGLIVAAAAAYQGSLVLMAG